ncbi:sugar kinase [Streptomyces sp. NPDC002889]|uniref:sugar kinase n=1 Tax=Streptomyces sp. NPDC002889 TaxID=3364669 RepID=UPI0036B1E26E
MVPGEPRRRGADAIVTATVHGPVDVVCLGESMVTFLPTREGRLAEVTSFARGIGGAESNVACALSAVGHRARWIGRVGADGFGEHLVASIAAYGVDTSAVQRDPDRPTGIYFRTATDRATDTHEVLYYRAGSAASAMSAATVPGDAVWSGRVLHVSGITAALSPQCLALMRDLTARRPGRPLVSFDVNHRPGLWRDAPGARVLLELARGADIVFVGEDEAEETWGVRGARSIRAALPEPEVVVVKRGARGATAFARRSEPFPSPPPGGTGGPPDAVTHMPAPTVDVVAPVGAGDAFAAGFLSATLRGLSVRHRLRHGHLMAAAVLTVADDLAAPPTLPRLSPGGAPTDHHPSASRRAAPLTRAHADRLAGLDDGAWGTLHLGPGWTAAADEEVRTA